MKSEKFLSILILCINAAGLICLIYFSIPYLVHSTKILYPDAMLPMESWDSAGMVLTIGMLPLLIVNILGFLCVKVKRAVSKCLFLLPTIICIAIVVHYWVTSLY